MRYWIGLICLLACTLAGCQASGPKSDKLAVMVSLPVQKEFVSAVGGTQVAVQSLLGTGDFPGSYELTAQNLKHLGDASVYFLMGYLPFEVQFSSKISSMYPKLKLVNLSRDLSLIQEHHDEGTAHDHSHHSHHFQGIDPHVWLSPRLVMKQVEQIRDQLIRLKPDQSDYFMKRAREYIVALKNLDADIRKKLAGLPELTVVVYHPFLGYFARDYGVYQLVLEERGQSPTARHLQTVVDTQKTVGVQSIIVQRGHSVQLARNLAKSWAGEVVEVDPLGPNYLENMRVITDTIIKVGKPKIGVN